jgi:hypothetical protein
MVLEFGFDDHIKENELGGSRSTNGEMRNVYKILVKKSEWKRSLGRPRRRWEGNIKMDLGEKRWEEVDWMILARD